MRILLIEDDAKTADFIVKGLQQSGFQVVHAADGEAGWRMASGKPFDLVIVDLMLPKMDGLTVIAKLREAKKNVPVIILSAKNSVDDKVRGLETGCDDYLAKPFVFSELLARIQALLRRASMVAEPTKLTVADLSIDLLSHKVTRGGEVVDIQPMEYALLEYLMRHTGRVVSKTMIMEHVWEYNFDPQTNIVEARVCRLRDKIDKPFERKLIHTVRGFGYVLE
jgi:two-component system OmpR family response regulator